MAETVLAKRKKWHLLRKGVHFFGTTEEAGRQRRKVLNRIKKGIPFPKRFLKKTLQSVDVDIGSLKKKEESRNFILMVVGLLVAVVLLIWMLKK